MAASDLCDMCQMAPYDVSNIVRENGQTTWLCWSCYPYAQAQYLAQVGWSIEAPKAPEVEEPAAEEEAGAADKPRRRPRVVKPEEEASPGPADPAGLEAAAADPDDQRRADRLESGSGAGAQPGPPSAGA